jgi:hypothetical protein
MLVREGGLPFFDGLMDRGPQSRTLVHVFHACMPCMWRLESVNSAWTHCVSYTYYYAALCLFFDVVVFFR